jgi:hypothetical protein
MYEFIAVFNSLACVDDHDTLQILLLPTDKSLVEYSAQRISERTVYTECST